MWFGWTVRDCRIKKSRRDTLGARLTKDDRNRGIRGCAASATGWPPGRRASCGCPRVAPCSSRAQPRPRTTFSPARSTGTSGSRIRPGRVRMAAPLPGTTSIEGGKAPGYPGTQVPRYSGSQVSAASHAPIHHTRHSALRHAEPQTTVGARTCKSRRLSEAGDSE